VNELTVQLSLAVGAVQVTTLLQLPAAAVVTIFEGIPLMVGLILSLMVTVKEAVVICPAASVAVYVTVVVPTGKVAPLVWVEVNELTLQLSPAVGAVQVTTLPQVPAVTFCVMFEGIPLMVGKILSTMVTVNEPVAVLPDGSVAV
jgi:hypothetical protein